MASLSVSMSAVRCWGADIANALMKALPLSTGTDRRFDRKAVRTPCTDDWHFVRFCSLCRMTATRRPSPNSRPVGKATLSESLRPPAVRGGPQVPGDENRRRWVLLRVATVRGSVTSGISRQFYGSARTFLAPNDTKGEGVYEIGAEAARSKCNLLASVACKVAAERGQPVIQRFLHRTRSAIFSRVWQAAMSARKRTASRG